MIRQLREDFSTMDAESPEGLALRERIENTSQAIQQIINYTLQIADEQYGRAGSDARAPQVGIGGGNRAEELRNLGRSFGPD